MNKGASLIASKLLEVRSLEKAINTYYTGFEKYIYKWDSCVHTTFSHCGYEKKNYNTNEDDFGGGTNTGRLSCTKPPLQVLPRDGKIKDHFVSRWGINGRIVACDFSQIEVVAFAHLTQDPQLMQDIRDGLDIHCVLGTLVYGEEITKNDPRRQTIKPCTFLVIYGGGYKKLAKTHNLPEDFCKQFIETFYRRYSVAKEWQDRLVKIVEGSRQYIDEYTNKGFQKEEGYLQNNTGRLLYFKTTDVPEFLIAKRFKELGLYDYQWTKNQFTEIVKNYDWMQFRLDYGQEGMTSFNPSEIKNYPVQSFATADLALMLHGRLWREAIKHRDAQCDHCDGFGYILTDSKEGVCDYCNGKGTETKFLLVNQIHDDIVADVKEEYVEMYCKLTRQILTDVYTPCKKYFNIEFDLKLGVEIKVGKDWGSCEKTDL